MQIYRSEIYNEEACQWIAFEYRTSEWIAESATLFFFKQHLNQIGFEELVFDQFVLKYRFNFAQEKIQKELRQTFDEQ